MYAATATAKSYLKNNFQLLKLVETRQNTRTEPNMEPIDVSCRLGENRRLTF